METRKYIETRKYWVDTMLKVALPVLENLANGTLKQNMPIDCKLERHVRKKFSHLEAFGRTVCGIAPWLENQNLKGEEEELRKKMLDLTLRALDRATDPQSPDIMNFDKGRQPLVDAAFLAHGILRAPTQLLENINGRVRENLGNRLIESRSIKPGYNNFILFSGMIEALLFKMGFWWDPMRVEYALRMTDLWYKGDGMYGDGQEFCFDYYNSFVIGPMMTDLCIIFCHQDKDWEYLLTKVKQRAKRYAGIQERLINSDGSFPAVGRSLAYRTGTFQHLAQMALQHNLPENIKPAQVRGALSALIHKVMEVPGTFNKNGWLQVGLYGYQPDIGEIYISTGSLYLCMTVFLPLGLSPQDAFWADNETPWTSKKIWNGTNIDVDEALHQVQHQTIYDHDEYLASKASKNNYLNFK